MKRIVLATVLYFLILSLGYSNVYAIDIPFLINPPVIDGNITKGEWDKSQHSKLIIIQPKNAQNRELQNKTDVYLGYDKEFLFASFVCHEKDMSKVKASIHNLEARDTDIWIDDCVEILLDPLASGTERYHFIINSNGIIYDALNRDAAWDSNIKVAAKKYDDRWVVEVAIPLSDFNYIPLGMEQWKGNFCREQKPDKENSSLFPTQSIIDSSSFGSLSFLKPTSTKSEDIHLSINQLWNKDEPGVKLSVENKGELKQNIKIEVSNTVNNKLYSSTSDSIISAPNKTTEVAIPYITSSGKQNVLLTVSNLSDNSILYRNQFTLPASFKDNGLSQNVWNVEDPLYSELFSNESFPLGKEGALSWIPSIDYNRMRTIAKQFGISYRLEDSYKMFGENKLRAFTDNHALGHPTNQYVSFSKKYDMKSVVFADNRKYSKDKIPFGERNTRPWAVDPVAIDAANQTVKEALENHLDVIWGVSLGDEVENRIFKIGIELLNKYSETDYPYIHQANREIIKHYGYGKYGIPLDEHDQNPFRWIAFRRWANQELVKMHDSLYKTVKDIAPEVLVIGNDPVSFHNPFNYRDMKCDIMTHQLYPRGKDDRARFGFLTKLNVDLSNNMEFWPCVHVENYASNFDHNEVLELMSQVIRNGGTGFHFYPKDIRNIRSGSNSLNADDYAAPDRWKLQMAIVEEMGKIKKLKTPNSDFAILFATDSHASFPYGGIESYEVESAYTFLGPIARSYFTFIDDYLVEDTPEQLLKYKVIYVPFAKYMRKEVANNLLQYVKNGGTLISGDPEIFSFCSDGTSLKQLAEKLFGISVEDESKQSQINFKELVLPVYSKAFAIKLRDKSNIKVMANYNDGTPAITEHKYGKGKAVFFAANPFHLKALNDNEWKTFFTQFQKEYSLEVGHDIWRFQFPKTLIPELTPSPKGKCLTNNNMVWRRNEGLMLYNEDTDGSYSYSLPPDKIKEKTGIQKNYSFVKGNLTNRKRAPSAGNVDLGKGSIQDWVVLWEKTDAFHITFDFIKPKNLGKVSLFYSGQLPDISLFASNDGENWIDLNTSTKKQASTADVLEHTLTGKFGNYQYIQIRFGERDNNSLTLAEVEVWSVQ